MYNKKLAQSLREGKAKPSMGEMMPTLHLTSKQLPDIKKWEVGHEYTIAMTVKQTSHSINTDGASAGFEILSVKEGEKEEPKEKEYRKQIVEVV